MERFGAPPEVIDAWRRELHARAQQTRLNVWPQHWYPVKVFEAMGSQWTLMPGHAGPVHVGLNYAALPVVLAEHRQTQHRVPLPKLMPKLRLLESVARDALNR